MAKRRQKRAIHRNVKKSIIQPTKSSSLWLFLIGAILAGAIFSIGSYYMEKILKKTDSTIGQKIQANFGKPR